MYMESNEPYQRVDHNGAALGAVAGLATAGATMGGSYLHMKGIPNRYRERYWDAREDYRTAEASQQADQSKFQEKRSKYSNKTFAYQNSLPGDSRLTRITNGIKDRVTDAKLGMNINKLQRMDKSHEASMNRSSERINRLNDKRQKYTSAQASEKVNNHMYSKHMGGWGRKAMIGGAATALGAGIGALTDHFVD
jgi:hypothetical protein